VYRVTKTANFPNFLEQTRRHAATKHAGEYLQTVKLIVAYRQSLQRHGDMHLLEVTRFDFGATTEMRGLGFGSARPLEGRQTLVDFRDDRLLCYGNGGSRQHVEGLGGAGIIDTDARRHGRARR